VAIAVVVILLVAGGIWFFLLRDGGEEMMPEQEQDQVVVPEDPGETPAPEPEVISDENCGDGFCDPGEEEVCPDDCPLPEEDQCGNGVCDADEDPDICPIDCVSAPTEPVVPPEPANQPLDSDGDGLSDEDEEIRGTNPQSADTDSDNLSDGEEVNVYGTDPTNPDTDGDSYLDGDEVKAGYNPNGEGRLLNLP
jgi:hypothetical protein